MTDNLDRPSTSIRIEAGLGPKGAEPRGRLEATGSANAMVSHRVKIPSLEEVDAELLRWLRDARERA